MEDLSYFKNLTDGELQNIISSSQKIISKVEQQKSILKQMGTTVEQHKYSEYSNPQIALQERHIQAAIGELQSRVLNREAYNQKIISEAQTEGITYVIENDGIAYKNYSPVKMANGERVPSQVIPTVKEATSELVYELVGNAMKMLRKSTIYFTKDSYQYKVKCNCVEVSENSLRMEPIEVNRLGNISTEYQRVFSTTVIGEFSFDELSREHLLNVFNQVRGY